MAVTGKGAEGIDLAARAMAWAATIDRRTAEPQQEDDLADADETAPEPQVP